MILLQFVNMLLYANQIECDLLDVNKARLFNPLQVTYFPNSPCIGPSTG